MSFASSFGATAYLGHASTACTSFEAKDEPLLFDRMTGHDDCAPAVGVSDAFAKGGFLDKQFQLVASKNVVLSPAVEFSAPSEGETLKVGAVTRATARVRHEDGHVGSEQRRDDLGLRRRDHLGRDVERRRLPAELRHQHPQGGRRRARDPDRARQGSLERRRQRSSSTATSSHPATRMAASSRTATTT